MGCNESVTWGATKVTEPNLATKVTAASGGCACMGTFYYMKHESRVAQYSDKNCSVTLNGQKCLVLPSITYDELLGPVRG